MFNFVHRLFDAERRHQPGRNVARPRLETLERRDVPTTAGWSVGAPPQTMVFASKSERVLDQVTAAYASDAVTVQDDVTSSLTFIAPTTGVYRFRTGASALDSWRSHDTVLGVYNAAGGLLGGNDDANGGRWSEVNVRLQAGQRYQVGVGRYLGAARPDGVTRRCQLAIDGPDDDRFEAQGGDSPAAAVGLGTVSGVTAVNDLVMADQADTFSFTLPRAGGQADSARIAFLHVQGDLDMELLNGANTVLRRAAGEADGEAISLGGLAAGAYKVRVYGYLGVVNPHYDLTISQSPVVAAPTLGQRMVAWVLPQVGTVIDRGECTDLVVKAMEAVGARPFYELGPTGLDADYVWGTLVAEFRPGSALSLLSQVQPGDVIQYRDFRSADGSFAPHHTAMVERNDGNGRLGILQQNWGPQGTFRPVRQDALDLSQMTQGVLWIYRPMAR